MENKINGVNLSEKINKKGIVDKSWVATFTLNGERLLKSFSVNKYGFDKAYEMACKTRLNFETREVVNNLNNILSSGDYIYVCSYKDNLSINYLKELEINMRTCCKVVFLKDTIFVYDLKNENWMKSKDIDGLNKQISEIIKCLDCGCKRCSSEDKEETMFTHCSKSK